MSETVCNGRLVTDNSRARTWQEPEEEVNKLLPRKVSRRPKRQRLKNVWLCFD